MALPAHPLQALLEMRKAVEHLQHMEGLLAEQDQRVGAPGASTHHRAAGTHDSVPSDPDARLFEARLAIAGRAPCNPRPRPPAMLQLEAAAEQLSRRVHAQQEQDITKAALRVVQGADMEVCGCGCGVGKGGAGKGACARALGRRARGRGRGTPSKRGWAGHSGVLKRRPWGSLWGAQGGTTTERIHGREPGWRAALGTPHVTSREPAPAPCPWQTVLFSEEAELRKQLEKLQTDLQAAASGMGGSGAAGGGAPGLPGSSSKKRR